MTRADRREFDVASQVAITKRATDEAGRIHCERCGRWCPKRADYQIDHVIAEGLRSPIDKKRKLKPSDGQLLCVASCHPPKTARDKGDIARAKRREGAYLGAVRPGKVEIARPKKPAKPRLRVAPGPPAMARRYRKA